MSVSYIGGSAGTATATSIVIASHASTKFGDLMVLLIHTASSVTTITGGSTPTWSKWGEAKTANALTHLEIWTARAVAADIGASFTVNVSVSANIVADLLTYRSTINTPLLQAIQRIVDDTNALTVITTPTWDNSAGGIGVAFAGCNTFSLGNNCAPTGANWTEVSDHGISGANVTDVAHDTASSGASNAGCTFTWTKVNTSRAAMVFVVIDGPTVPTVPNSFGTTAASGTSLGIVQPAGIQAGDLLLAVIANVSTSSALVQPPGWTVLDTPAGAIASSYKIADGTESGLTATWTWTGASVSCGLITIVRGGSAQPIDAHSAQANASSANLTAPAVTPKWTACLLINVYVDIAANAITVPTTQTGTGAGSTSGNSRSITSGWEPLNSAASTGTRVATATAAVNYGFSFAIRGPVTPTVVVPDSVVGANNGIYAYRDASLPVGPTFTGLGIGAQWAGRNPYSGFPGNVFQGFGGTASISGTCKIGTLPLAGIWVFLSPMSSQGTVLAAQYTGADGTFSFTGIAPGAYVIEGIDPSGTYNAQIFEEVVAY